ncbi:class F sortase [Agromyces salentinus]|uniref:class F sortase n=1 Tax=Agromyces salentinus TaxID=269421 RepID=UPI001478B978|nr:class F sortase [Agromyces salentinus]
MAVLAVVLALGGCGTGTGTGTGGTGEGTSAAASGRDLQATGLATSPPAEAPATPLPEIPVSSAALEDRPALTGPAPVRFQAPDLGIDVAVEAVGLDDRGAMGLPANPSIAAWYRFGAAPGAAAGSVVVAAHVDSLEYDIGPFARLAAAPAGTRFLVTTADGTTHEYALTMTEVVPKEQVDWSAAFARDGAPRLTLVTCGGDFDYDARRYLSNVLVTAEPTG